MGMATTGRKGESRGSKGKRIVVFSVLVFFIALFGSAIAGGASAGISSVQPHTLVLSPQNDVNYAYGMSSNGTAKALSIGNVNNTVTVTNEYAYTVKNATGVSTTDYATYLKDFLMTNMTLGEMNLHSVNKLNITTDIAVNATLVIGYGTSYSNFVPISASSYTAKKNTTADFGYAIGPASLTGNQSDYLMMELELSNKSTPPTYSISVHTTGIASGLFNYQTGLDVSYVIDGALILIFAFLTIPHYDVNVKPAPQGMITQKVKVNKANKNRR